MRGWNNMESNAKNFEKMSLEEKIEYLKLVRSSYTKKTGKNVFQNLMTNLYPFLRNYDYKIQGLENLPDDGRGIFVCNHSNSHDFFTANEVFKKINSNVSVFAADDDLDIFTKTLFSSCNAVLIDRNDKASIERGIINFSEKVINGLPGVIFGEGTWNLHPYKPMQQIKLGSSRISSMTDVPIIPTIFQYVEKDGVCTKESDLYDCCIVRFGKPIVISKTDSLIEQTQKLQTVMEQNRQDIWKSIGINRKNLGDVDKDIYLNHTYLKKFGAFGFEYDSLSEQQHLYFPKNIQVENEFCLNENNEFAPGITDKKTGKKYVKLK